MVCWVQHGLGVPGGCEDLGAVPVQGHRGGAERAADLAHGRGALDPVVAVLVVGGEPAELVTAQLGGLGVVRGDVVAAGVAGERPESGEGAGGGRAVEVPVGDDRAVVGALGAAVVGVQVLDQLRRRRLAAAAPRRPRRGGRSRNRRGRRRAGSRRRASRSARARTRGPGRAGTTRALARRANSGTAGAFSSRIMIAAEK